MLTAQSIETSTRIAALAAQHENPEWYTSLVALSYEKTGNIEAAIRHADETVQQFPKPDSVMEFLSQTMFGEPFKPQPNEQPTQFARPTEAQLRKAASGYSIASQSPKEVTFKTSLGEVSIPRRNLKLTDGHFAESVYHALNAKHAGGAEPKPTKEKKPKAAKADHSAEHHEGPGQHHAPSGGVTIGGKDFHGGEFIPPADFQKAPEKVQEAIEEHKPVDTEEKPAATEKPKAKSKKLAPHPLHSKSLDEIDKPHGYQQTQDEFVASHTHPEKPDWARNRYTPGEVAKLKKLHQEIVEKQHSKRYQLGEDKVPARVRADYPHLEQPPKPKEENSAERAIAEAGADEVAMPKGRPMQQWADLKKQHPDQLILLRVGDFYETFHGDAETAAKTIGLTLTTRDKGGENPTPMAGFPHHALESYLRKLIQSGHRVAVAEQVSEAPKVAKPQKTFIDEPKETPADKSHLNALELRLSHERSRLAAETTESGIKYRQAQVASIEKEIAGEKKFLGIADSLEVEQSDDELLSDLFDEPTKPVEPEAPKFSRTTPAKGTPERERLESDWQSIRDADKAAREQQMALEDEIERAKSGSKKKDQLKEKLAKHNEANRDLFEKRETMRQHSRKAFLEDVAEHGDEANRLAAEGELVNGGKSARTQAEFEQGKERFRRIQELAKEAAMKHGATPEEAEAVHNDIASMILGYPGVYTPDRQAETSLRVHRTQRMRALGQKAIEGTGVSGQKRHDLMIRASVAHTQEEIDKAVAEAHASAAKQREPEDWLMKKLGGNGLTNEELMKEFDSASRLGYVPSSFDSMVDLIKRLRKDGKLHVVDGRLVAKV